MIDVPRDNYAIIQSAFDGLLLTTTAILGKLASVLTVSDDLLTPTSTASLRAKALRSTN